MVRLNKKSIKHFLGELPYTAELYWQLRQQGQPLSKSGSLKRTERYLPEWRAQAEAARKFAPPGKSILLFATLRYWIEYSTLLGLSLAGSGHRVSLAYLPYTNWREPVTRFDIRRQNAYFSSVLKQAEPLVTPVSLLGDLSRPIKLPADLHKMVHEVSLRDVQYTLQLEEVDTSGVKTPSGVLYQLRMTRNSQAALAFLSWAKARPPDLVITPNGMIFEIGVVYQVARYLDIPVVTYEFGEQRDRIWLVKNDEVMRQNTDHLWLERKDRPLTEVEWQQIRKLFDSRQQASLWENFSRRWQGLPGQGGEKTRQDLALDCRPVVVLAANVIGDSLTLGRQVFSQNMTEWLQQTVYYFAARPDAQLVIRIHPGERYTRGPSVADVVTNTLPNLPDNIHLIAADAPVNTYDLIEIADLGLVYTTTVGMEMAMTGVPVIVAGQTHYRGKGFTQDPCTWDEYYELITNDLSEPGKYRLLKYQVEQAWNYAYRFYFEYPLPFPWHLLNFWNDLETWSIDRVLSEPQHEQFREAFECLAGKPRDFCWVEESERIEAA